MIKSNIKSLFIVAYIYRPQSATSVDQSKRQKVTIWPEWSDADINAEKWVFLHLFQVVKFSCPFQSFILIFPSCHILRKDSLFCDLIVPG